MSMYEDIFKYQCVTDYKNTQKFKENLREKWIDLIKDIHGNKKYEEIFKVNHFHPFNDDRTPYAPQFGIFTEELLKVFIKEQDDENFNNEEAWDQHNEFIDQALSAVRCNDAKKTQFNKLPGDFANSRYGYFCIKKTQDSDYFKAVVDHFRWVVFPYIKNWNLISGKEFRDRHPKIDSICDITHWEMDFFDPKNNEIVDVKFSKSKLFDSEWLWQILLYVYVVNFYHNDLQVSGVKIINTRQGIEYSAKIEDLFGKDGFEKFKSCSEQEIENYEDKSIDMFIENISKWKNSGNFPWKIKKYLNFKNENKNLKLKKKIAESWSTDEDF